MTLVVEPKAAIVLIVEDDPFLRVIVMQVIEEAGFGVLDAANADEAIEIMERRSDIRIVFTDIDMPGSMDGMTMAIIIRGRWPPVEILVTSGGNRKRLNELPDRGVFVPKPYMGDEIVATLQRLAA